MHRGMHTVCIAECSAEQVASACGLAFEDKVDDAAIGKAVVLEHPAISQVHQAGPCGDEYASK